MVYVEALFGLCISKSGSACAEGKQELTDLSHTACQL
jgi:hypothetical protein